MKFSPLILLLVFSLYETAESLEAIQVGKLPRETAQQTAYYDENSDPDSIYLFGGYFNDFMFNNYDIYKYSISNNSLSTVAQLPTTGLVRNYKIKIIPPSPNSSVDSNTLFYLLPRENVNTTYVFKYNLLTGNSFLLGTLPFTVYNAAWTRAPNGDTLLFRSRDIIKLNLESESVQYEVLGEMPSYVWLYNFNLATVDKTTFVFGGRTNEDTGETAHITVDLETLESSVPLSTLPNFGYTPHAFSTSEGEVYIFGGFQITEDHIRAIFRMNATTQEYEILPVPDVPLPQRAYYSVVPAAAYVERLKRVYFFGGLQYSQVTNILLDDIWYIQLE